MKRRNFVRLGGSVVGLGIVGATPALGAKSKPKTPEYPPGKTTGRGNWIRGQAEDVEVYSVTAEYTADLGDGWGDKDFTFYTVRFEPQEYDTWVYREPARLGGGNYDVENDEYATSNSFWYGVTGPYGDEIVHDGQVIQYFETVGGWTELTAKFDDGELIDVNGVEPE